MKKQLSALALAAALATPAIASAQQVELRPYLSADASLGFDLGGDKLFLNEDVEYHNGNIATSVYGLRGAVDLGNGLTVHGHLEGDFDTSTGNHHPAGMFRRAANVGVSGAFGRVDLGTKMNPFIAFHSSSYAMGGNSVSTSIASGMGYANFFTQRSVTYTAPKYAGLSAQVQYGFEDPTTGQTPFNYAHESIVAGNVNYEIAGFSIGAAAMDVKGAAGTADRTTWMIGAGYKLDALTLKAAWIDNDDVAAGGASDNNTAWQVGASYALTPQLAVGGNYLQHDSGSSLANLQARYALAKNMVIYGLVNHVDNDDNGPDLRALWGAGGVGAGLQNGGSGTALATGVIISF